MNARQIERKVTGPCRKFAPAFDFLFLRERDPRVICDRDYAVIYRNKTLYNNKVFFYSIEVFLYNIDTCDADRIRSITLFSH